LGVKLQDFLEWLNLLFSSPCQRQCKFLPSVGIRRPLSFHILIFSSEKSTNQKQEWPVAAMFINGSELNEHFL
jgi:hypothetical protein